MSLVFERIQTEGIAELSYLLGEMMKDRRRFRPDADVDKYIERRARRMFDLAHLRDAYSRGFNERCARALRAVDSANIYVSHEGGAQYGFETEKLHDGDTFTLGMRS